MTPRVLILRPREDALALAALLETRGYAPVIAPLLTVHALPEAKAQIIEALTESEALLVTSRHALPSLPICDLPLYAVGERTAAEAARKGFRVAAQAPDFAALIPLLPPGIRLLYARGREVAHEAPALLAEKNITVREIIAYHADAPADLPAEAAEALQKGELEAALFFSPRGAEIFISLVEKAGLREMLRPLTALALSDAVARPLQTLPWGAVRVSDAPTQDSLVAALDKAMRERYKGSMQNETDETPPTTPPRPGSVAALKRLGMLFAVLFALWVVFTFAAPYLLNPLRDAAIGTPPAPTPMPAITPLAPPPPAAALPPPPPPPPASDSSEMQERLRQLEQRLQEMQDSANEAALSAQTAKMLDERIASNQQQLSQLKSQADSAVGGVALLVAYDRLKDAVLSGRPYSEPLARLQELAAGRAAVAQAIEPLRAFAEYGIPTREALTQEFDRSALRALHPPLPADAGFFRKVKHNLGSLITIRRVGAVEGDSPEALIAQAEQAANEGNLTQAVARIETLNSPAFNAWLAHARAHAARDAALPALQQAILTAARPAASQE